MMGKYQMPLIAAVQVHPIDSLISPATPQICEGYIIIKTTIKNSLFYNVFFFFVL
jgi:hypothetical protein